MKHPRARINAAIELLLIRGSADSWTPRRGLEAVVATAIARDGFETIERLLVRDPRWNGRLPWGIYDVADFVGATRRVCDLAMKAFTAVDVDSPADRALEAAQLLAEGWRPGDPVVRL